MSSHPRCVLDVELSQVPAQLRQLREEQPGYAENIYQPSFPRRGVHCAWPSWATHSPAQRSLPGGLVLPVSLAGGESPGGGGVVGVHEEVLPAVLVQYRYVERTTF